MKTWLVDFYTVKDGKASEKPVETVEIKRAYAPTRWARNHVLTLRRRFQGASISFSITGF